jgi:uncharacterized protein (TIGR00661 family)
MRKKILYAIIGVGAGNTSRTLAILEQLPPNKYDIHFVSQGKAYELLSARVTTYQLGEVTYTKGDFNILSILRHNYSFPYTFVRNVLRAGRIIDETKPDCVIVDSDFFFLHPARKRKIPIVSINSSVATVKKFQQLHAHSFDRFFSYYFVEKVDYWLQRSFPDRVICPVITDLDGINGKFCQVGPIVRKQFLEGNAALDDARYEYDIAVMFGGSGISTGELDLRPFQGSCLVLGQKERLKLPANARVIDFDSEPAKYLARAKIVVVQGGLNSISEVIAMRKPAVFVPIKGHAEQFVNAHWAEELGIGVVSEGRTVVDAIGRVEARYGEFVQRYKALDVPCNGAVRAASLIQEFIDG